MWKYQLNNLAESGDAAAGLVLTALMTILTRLPHVMRQSVLVENMMTSVERIIEYGTLKPEAYLEDACSQCHDKLEGQLRFEHVWLRYAEDEKYVLKDITFTIHEKEKVFFSNFVYISLTVQYSTHTTDRCCWPNWCRKILAHHCPLSPGRA